MMRPSLSVVQTVAVAAEEGWRPRTLRRRSPSVPSIRAIDKPLEADGNFEHGAVEALGDAVDDGGRDESLADADG